MKNVFVFLIVVKMCVQIRGHECGVVPIFQWGEGPLNRDELLFSPVSLVVIQHTATHACQSDDDCEVTVNAIRSFQTQQLGFCDIGYSFLIGGNGKVYEGAGWNYVGAHTKKYNGRSIGIAFIGDFREKLPSPLALKALRSLLSCGVNKKHLTEGYHLVAHSQLSNTQSPGALLQKHVEMWPHWLDHPKELLD